MRLHNHMNDPWGYGAKHNISPSEKDAQKDHLDEASKIGKTRRLKDWHDGSRVCGEGNRKLLISGSRVQWSHVVQLWRPAGQPSSVGQFNRVKRPDLTLSGLPTIKYFIYSCLCWVFTSLCCARAFSCRGEWGLLSVVVHRFLVAVASFMAEHGL